MSDDAITKSQLSQGLAVVINPKNDRTRSLMVEGLVKDILTNSEQHPHGIMVSLESGEIGRVKKILSGQSFVTDSTEAISPDEAKPIEEVIEASENHFVEFKSSALWSQALGRDEIERRKK